MSEADGTICRRYVARQVSPAVEAGRLRQDLLNVEAALEQAERHARSIRDTRDTLLAQLVNLDD